MQNEETATGASPTEPPVDTESIETHARADRLKKVQLLQLARDCGLPATMPLDAALKTYDVFSTARRILMTTVGDAPSLLEISPGAMTSLPSPLRSHAWWYVRLPDSWASRVDGIAAASYLQAICMRSEDPWYVAQYLSLVVYDRTGAQTSWASPRLIVEDREVRATLFFHDYCGVFCSHRMRRTTDHHRLSPRRRPVRHTQCRRRRILPQAAFRYDIG
jgi:hypothetical protein